MSKTTKGPSLRHPGMSNDAVSQARIGVLKWRYGLTRLRAVLKGKGSDDEHGIETLLISASASPIGKERRDRLKERWDAPSWQPSQIEACYPPDPESMDETEYAAFHTMPERVPSGHRACFLSHRRAWKKASKSTAVLTIVLEDDAKPLFRRRPELGALPDGLDVLYLHHFAQYLPSWREAITKGHWGGFRVYPIDEVTAVPTKL